MPTSPALRFLALLLPLLLLLLYPLPSHSHGLLTYPPQRGALNPLNRFNLNATFPSTPIDGKPHFPAGDKDSIPGSAARSQVRAAQPEGWSPFLPLDPDFRWRAGVCGDLKGPIEDHRRGGRYYGDGMITATYTQGEVIELWMNIVANHNGFVELHLCDVDKCGGEISESCFRQGHCRQLQRAPNAACDSGMDFRCAPIDPQYPGRWYLPCATLPENTQEYYGGSKMTYQLPEGMACEHCVLHWFWSAANTCNPPGVIAFYEGEFGPRTWGDCFGQGGARGGYTTEQRDCGRDRFPEEYYQCADIKIVGRGEESGGATNEPGPTVTPTPSVTPRAGSVGVKSGEVQTGAATSSPEVEVSGTPEASMGASGGVAGQMQNVFEKLVLVADGEVVETLRNGNEVNISRYDQVAIEAVTRNVVSRVVFYLDGDRVWTDFVRPYFMFGNLGRVPNYWDEPIVGRWFTLTVMAEDEGDTMEVEIKLVR